MTVAAQKSVCCFFAVALLICGKFAAAQQAGSIGAYRAMAGVQNRVLQDRAERLRSFKITQFKQRISQYEESLKKGEIWAVCPGPALVLDKLSTNDIGSLTYWAFEVNSVVDESNVILSCGDSDIWLTGYKTSELSDGQEVTIIDPIKVLEPKSFTTVIGAKRTIKCVQLISDKEFQPTLEKYALEQKTKELEKQKEIERQELLKYEDYTLKNGKLIRAKIVAIDKKKNKIAFQLIDKSEKEFVVSAFSKASAEKLRKKMDEFNNIGSGPGADLGGDIGSMMRNGMKNANSTKPNSGNQ
jgi:hypothetical protein